MLEVIASPNVCMMAHDPLGRGAQKIHSGSELTFLKAEAAHLSKIFLVVRHLFSS